MIRVVCVQLLLEPGNIAINVAKVLEYIGKASGLGADIVCFQELATCGVVNDPSVFAEELTGKTVSAISAAARKRHVHVAFGLPELSGNRIYNTALLLDRQGRILGQYHKTHLSLDTCGGELSSEADIFASGNDYHVFAADFGRLGIMICKDGLFPEVSRIYALQGCEILLWLNSRPELNPSHLEMIANVNRLVLVASNRAASPIFDGGGSSIVTFEDSVHSASKPNSFRHAGSFLARAGKGETILCADVDMDYARQRREAWLKHWLNRHPETYGLLVEIGSRQR